MPRTRSPRRRRRPAAMLAAAGVAGAWLATTPQVAGAAGPIRLRYGIAGTATLKTLTRGVLPLRGVADGALDLATSSFTAAFSFERTTGRFTALGFLPVRADIDVVPLEPATGTITPDGTTATVKLRIAVPSISILGFRVGGGPDCGTVHATSVTLHSTTDASPLESIAVAGTFPVGPVAGCGPLTRYVAPLAAGDGNAIALLLTPQFDGPPARRTTAHVFKP